MAALPPLSELKQGDVISRRWEQGLPRTNDYYYDEPVIVLTKNSTDFPPKHMDLSNAWVVIVVKSGISGSARQSKYPDVFTGRSLKVGYVHKGQAAKEKDPNEVVKYVQIFGDTNMIGEEGMEGEASAKSTKGTPHTTVAVELTLVAQGLSMSYDYRDAAKRARAARQKLSKRQVSAVIDSPSAKRRS